MSKDALLTQRLTDARHDVAYWESRTTNQYDDADYIASNLERARRAVKRLEARLPKVASTDERTTP